MPKSSKTKSTHSRRAPKKASHESDSDSDLAGDALKEGASKILDFELDQAKESVQDYANHSTPEFEGLDNATDAKEEAAEKGNLDDRSFARKLQRLKAAGGAGPSEQEMRELTEKEEAAKKTAGNAAFAEKELDSDESNRKVTEGKIRELEEEHAQLVKDTTGWTKFLALKPQYVLEKTKKQTEQELEDQRRILKQQEKRIAQDKEKKFKTADAANAAQEDLDDSREDFLSGPRPPEGSTGRDSTLSQVTDALGKGSDANKNLIDALKSFATTAEALKTLSMATKQKLDEVTRALEAQSKAIQELQSSRQSGLPIPNP